MKYFVNFITHPNLFIMKSLYLLLLLLAAPLAQAKNDAGAPPCTIDYVTAFEGLSVGYSSAQGLIKWSFVPSATLYEVEINSIGLYGNADIINTYYVPGSQNTMLIDLFIHNWFGNNNGKYLSFRVRAFCGCEEGGWGEFTETQCFLFGTGVVPCGSYNGRIANTNVQTKVGIYPNPVDATINLTDIKPERGMQYEILNYQSEVLKSGILNSKTIDVNGMKDGIYLLSIKKGGETISTVKFLKN